MVSLEICAVFETEVKMQKTFGIYAKPIKKTGDFETDLMKILFGYNEKFRADEYCINEYDNKKFKLLKYTKNLWEQWNPEKVQTELDWIIPKVKEKEIKFEDDTIKYAEFKKKVEKKIIGRSLTFPEGWVHIEDIEKILNEYREKK